MAVRRSRPKEPTPSAAPRLRALPGLALSSGYGVVQQGHAGRSHGHAAGSRAPAEEARMLAAWDQRCARTLPFRSGRLADEPARILGPVVRGRSD